MDSERFGRDDPSERVRIIFPDPTLESGVRKPSFLREPTKLWLRLIGMRNHGIKVLAAACLALTQVGGSSSLPGPTLQGTSEMYLSTRQRLENDSG
jgi:hypothetical protein